MAQKKFPKATKPSEFRYTYLYLSKILKKNHLVPHLSEQRVMGLFNKLHYKCLNQLTDLTVNKFPLVN